MTEDYLKYYIVGAGGGDGGEPPRYPIDDPEGIINQTGIDGNLIPTGAVAITRTEVIDLLSEGPINGLVSGYWNYSGQIGMIGYSGAEFNTYKLDSSLINGVPAWLRSVYWNQVPVIDSAGKANFSNLTVGYTKGNVTGSLLNSARNELTFTKILNERLRASEIIDGVLTSNPNDYAKIYRILNPNCQGVYVNIKFPNLLKRNLSEAEYGDIEKTLVKYNIEYRPLFSNRKPSEDASSWIMGKEETVEGKVSSPYIKSSRLIFDSQGFLNDEKFIGWEIRIKRTTPDSTDTVTANQTYIDSITQIFSNKFTYPNSAMVRSEFLSEYFSSVPSRSFDVELLKVYIPSNYNPRLKSYNGEWDGTFSDEREWTDNPAWCYYDLLTSRRYGLGKYVDQTKIDKWTLYKIGQYCDQLVDDGFGGVEPRFTCNLLINTREEAFKVLNDLASIFNGMSYYANGSFFVSADHYVNTDEAVMEFTNANVKEGIFNYSTSPKSSRRSTAIVRYNNRDNFYKPAVEYVEDVEAIKKYGFREFELTAYGCTSRAQAIRYGKWALATENQNYESINYSAGMEAAILRPGDIVKVYDRYRQGPRLGGRLTSVSGNIAYLDTNLSGLLASGALTGNYYSLTLTTPTYQYNPVSVDLTSSVQISGIRNWQTQTRYFTGIGATGSLSGLSRIQLNSGFDFTNNYTGIQFPVYIIDVVSGNLPNAPQSEYWRVLNVEETEPNEFNILGLSYEKTKYDYISTGVRIEQTIKSHIPTRPSALVINPYPGATNQEGSDAAGWMVKADWVAPLNTNLQTNKEIFTIKNYKVFVSTNGTASKDNYDLDTVVDDDKDGVGTFDTTNTWFTYRVEPGLNYSFAVYTVNNNNDLSDTPVEATYSKLTSDIQFNNLNGAFDVLPIGVMNERSGRYTETAGNGAISASDVLLDQQTTNLRLRLNAILDATKNIAPEDVFYRVTLRAPSTNLIYSPSGEIYHQITGLPYSNEDFNFTLDFEYQVTGIIPLLPQSPPPPYRNYDIVVDIHDKDGNSSAGGAFSGPNKTINRMGLADSTYTQAKGWSMVHIYNPPITGIYLSTGKYESKAQAFTSGVTRTWQYLFNQSDFMLSIKDMKVNYYDVAGVFLFYSGRSFTTGHAYSGLTAVKRLNLLDDNGNPYSLTNSDANYDNGDLVINLPQFQNMDSAQIARPVNGIFSTGFAAVGFYDTIDHYKFNFHNSTVLPQRYTGIQISNVVRISGDL